MHKNNKITALMVKLPDGTYKNLMPIREVPNIGSKRITNRQKIWQRWSNNEITNEERDLLLKKNEEKLEKKRKYKKGEPIKSLDELMQQEFIYFQHKIYHYGWFGSWQGHCLKRLLDSGSFYKAIKKHNAKENSKWNTK